MVAHDGKWYTVHVHNAITAPVVLGVVLWFHAPLFLVVPAAVMLGCAWTLGGLAWLMRREALRMGAGNAVAYAEIPEHPVL